MPNILMLLGRIPSPLLHLNMIPLPLFILVIYRLMRPVVLKWVHMDYAIHVLPKINTHFITTVPTLERDFPITVFLSMNKISRLVSMNEHVIKTRSLFCELFRPYSYNRQQNMFYPSAVGFY